MNWQPILRELLRYTTLRELGRVVEITYQTLGKLAVGYEIDIGFVKGMRLLALHDYVAKQTESGRVLDQFRLWAVANSQSLQPRQKGKRKLASDRIGGVCPVQPRSSDSDGLVQHASGSERASEVRA